MLRGFYSNEMMNATAMGVYADDLYTRAVGAGDVEAAVNLAWVVSQGTHAGIERNDTRARALSAKAIALAASQGSRALLVPAYVTHFALCAQAGVRALTGAVHALVPRPLVHALGTALQPVWFALDALAAALARAFARADGAVIAGVTLGESSAISGGAGPGEVGDARGAVDGVPAAQGGAVDRGMLRVLCLRWCEVLIAQRSAPWNERSVTATAMLSYVWNVVMLVKLRT